MADHAIKVRHIGGDHFAIKIRGHEVEVDQPTASGGTDLAPTPSELFVASIASCAAFYAGRFLRRHDVQSSEWTVECRYGWSAEQRSSIDTVDLELVLPPGTPEDVREGAIRAADHCAVRESIRSGVDVRVNARTPTAAPELVLA